MVFDREKNGEGEGRKKRKKEKRERRKKKRKKNFCVVLMPPTTCKYLGPFLDHVMVGYPFFNPIYTN